MATVRGERGDAQPRSAGVGIPTRGAPRDRHAGAAPRSRAVPDRGDRQQRRGRPRARPGSDRTSRRNRTSCGHRDGVDVVGDVLFERLLQIGLGARRARLVTANTSSVAAFSGGPKMARASSWARPRVLGRTTSADSRAATRCRRCARVIGCAPLSRTVVADAEMQRVFGRRSDGGLAVGRARDPTGASSACRRGPARCPRAGARHRRRRRFRGGCARSRRPAAASPACRESVEVGRRIRGDDAS